MTTWTHERAVLASAVQRGDTATADKARVGLKAARAELYIRELVASAPQLTAEQRDRLAMLLRPTGNAQ